MSNVEGKKLGDILNLKRGYDLPSYEREDGLYPIFSSSGISGYHSQYKADGEGVVIGRYGTLGEPYYVNGKYWPHNTSLYVTDFKENSPKYVYYLLKCLGDIKTSDKSTVPGVNRNELHEMSVPFVTIREQQDKIAAVLSALDAKIELNNRINAELESLAKTIYDYWFVQFDFPFDFAQGKPSADGKPYKSSGGEMVYAEEGKSDRAIPAGWEVKPLAHWIANDKGGDWGKEEKQGNYTQKVICIRGTDVNSLSEGGEIFAPIRYILEKSSHKIIKPYDLIIEISGGSPTQSTGRLGYLSPETLNRFDLPIICSNFCRAISLKNVKNFYYFVYLWNDIYNNKILFNYEGKTSGIKNLLFESFINSHLTIIPEYSLIERFFEIRQSIQIKQQNNLHENQQLTQLRDWLLPMLMNGQVSIK